MTQGMNPSTCSIISLVACSVRGSLPLEDFPLSREEWATSRMQKNCLQKLCSPLGFLIDCLFHRRHPYLPSQTFSVLASCMGHERQTGLSWVNVHWTSYSAGDPNTPWGCPGMHAHEDVQMLLQSILLLKTLVLSRRLNIFLKCNTPFLKEPRARRDTWNHLIPCLWVKK